MVLLILLILWLWQGHNRYSNYFNLDAEMASKVRPISLRLPGELGEKFNALRHEFPGLPAGIIARLLIAEELKKPLGSQIEAVVAGLRRPGAANEGKRSGRNATGLNRVSL